MLMPKKVKHRKQHRGRMSGKAWRGSTVSFGDYGLRAMEPCWLTDRQIEAARVAMTRSIKRGGKIWIRVFPDKPITKKPQETRMGKGKGAPEQWVAVVKSGRILFEMEGVDAALECSGFFCSSRQGGDAVGGGEAPHSHEVRHPFRRCGGVMTAIAELRDLTSDDLEQRERDLAEQLFRLRLQKSLGQQEAAGKVRDTRRDLARVKTLLREHALLGAGSSGGETEEVDGN